MERYSIIFDRLRNLYAKDTEIIIKRAVLTKDNETGKVFAQIRMSNLLSKPVVTAKIALTGRDISGAVLEEKTFTYLDINAGQREDFGQKTPVHFEDSAVRSLDIKILETVYSDGSKLSDCGTGLLALQEADPLLNELSTGRIKRCQTKNTSRAKYAFHKAYINNETESSSIDNKGFYEKHRYKIYAIAGMLSAVVGWFFCSVIFSSLAIILGAIVISKSNESDDEFTARINFGIATVLAGMLGFIIMMVAVFGFGKNGLIPFAKTTDDVKFKSYVEEHIGRVHEGRVIAYKSSQINKDGGADILFDWDSELTYEYGKIGEIQLDKSGNIVLCSICSYLETRENYNYNDAAIDETENYDFYNSNDYLFPSDTVYIQKYDLDCIGQYKISLIRNEIYARHGYIFKTEPYKSYFESKRWYYPNTYFSESSFNDIEKANIKIITEYEKSMGWR